MKLDVPFIKQISENACGAASLEMVYRYYNRSKLSKFSQKKLLKRLGEFEPHGSGNRRLSADDIVATARERRLHAGWGRVSLVQQDMAAQVKFFVEEKKVPLIACQRFSDESFTIGHFRVIVGFDEDGAILHDPYPDIGGAFQKWPWDKLLDYWKQTGHNVTGGVVIWVAQELIANRLAPDMPNLWDQQRWMPMAAQ